MSAQYVVPEEWRGRVAEAIGDALGGSCMRQAGACSDDPEFCGCQRAAAAACAAVIPLAVAQERERCAALVDCTCAHRAVVLAVRDENSADRWRACGSIPCSALEARAIRQEPGHE